MVFFVLSELLMKDFNSHCVQIQTRVFDTALNSFKLMAHAILEDLDMCRKNV